MNNEQKIIDAIIADAKLEEEKIIKAANEEAENIIELSKAQAEKENAPVILKAKNTAAEAASKEVSAADMEAKKLVLMEKQALLAETVAAAKDKLNNLPLEEYKKALKTMLLSAGEPEGMTIILSDKDKAKVSDVFTEKGFAVDEQVRPIGRGFIIKKGDIEYNYTFDSIFSVSKEQLEETAAQILFS